MMTGDFSSSRAIITPMADRIIKIKKSDLRRLVKEALTDPKVLREMDRWDVTEDDEFDAKRYGLLARQVMAFWPQRTIDTNWSAIVDKFIKHSEKNTAKKLDKEKLMAALEDELAKDKNQSPSFEV